MCRKKLSPEGNFHSTVLNWCGNALDLRGLLWQMIIFRNMKKAKSASGEQCCRFKGNEQMPECRIKIKEKLFNYCSMLWHPSLKNWAPGLWETISSTSIDLNSKPKRKNKFKIIFPTSKFPFHEVIQISKLKTCSSMS